MKFLADMGIPQSTVRWLRQLGYDTVHLREQGFQRHLKFSSQFRFSDENKYRMMQLSKKQDWKIE